jgi:hypothetical protein
MFARNVSIHLKPNTLSDYSELLRTKSFLCFVNSKDHDEEKLFRPGAQKGMLT